LVELSISPNGNQDVHTFQVPEGELFYVEEAFYVIQDQIEDTGDLSFRLKTFLGVHKEFSEGGGASQCTRLFTQPTTIFTNEIANSFDGQMFDLAANPGSTDNIGGYLYEGERVRIEERKDTQSQPVTIALVLVGRRVLP
jgi:hypothetical protein